MSNLNKYPYTNGVPPTLFFKRIEGESYEDFKNREKENHKTLRNYFKQPIGERGKPSVRILKRLKTGSRSVNDLRPYERKYIQNIIGFKRYKELEDSWLFRLQKFLFELNNEIGTKEFWEALKTTVEEHEKLKDE